MCAEPTPSHACERCHRVTPIFSTSTLLEVHIRMYGQTQTSANCITGIALKNEPIYLDVVSLLLISDYTQYIVKQDLNTFLSVNIDIYF